MTLRRLALISLLPLVACAAPSSEMKLYPLRGPIAEATPSLIIDLNAKVTETTSGTLAFKLPRRVKCKGTWTTVSPRETARTKGFSLSLRGPNGNLDRTTKTVAGVNDGEIYAVCNDGTRIQGNFKIGSGTISGTGSATDTNGNVYKLLF
ncbi:hypothetical protein [Cypionkella sp.]|uniref:hypothetical protein n=1 Tax=Cypionkella sp. TaxID=2811411 RepID=UPI002FDEB2DF